MPTHQLVDILRKTIAIRSGGAKIVAVSYASRNPEFAAGLVNALLEEFEARPANASSTSADMTFIRDRVTDVRTRLVAKESEIAQAQTRSLDYKQPDAKQRLASLAREARLLEKLYAYLSSEYARAEIRTSQTENASSSEIEILRPAEVPLKPSAPNRKKIVVIFLFIGMVLSGAAAFVIEYFRGMRRELTEHPFWRIFRLARRDLILMGILAVATVLLALAYYLLR